MTNQEILDKAREAELLVIKALNIMNDIHSAVNASSTMSQVDIRRNVTGIENIRYKLWLLVEPGVAEAQYKVSISDTESDWCPRGELGILRMRMELICGFRQASNPPSFKYSKVEETKA